MNVSRHSNLSFQLLPVVSRSSVLSAIVLAGGCVLNVYAYGSFGPLLAVGLVFLFGYAITIVIGGSQERSAFELMFATGWFMAGVAGIYANFLNDPFQNTSDAATFYELSTARAAGATAVELSMVTEGAGIVLVWRWVYDFFAGIGLEKGRYVGVLVNVLAVALSAVMTVKTAAYVYGRDQRRMRRLTLMFSACGIFWLFSAIHVRDAIALLGVCGLLYAWVRYLSQTNLSSFVLVVGSTIVGIGFFGFLRAEFVFVPSAMLFAALASMLLCDRSAPAMRFFIYAVAGVSIVALATIAILFGEELLLVFRTAQEVYVMHVLQSGADGSLGSILVTAPLLPRLVFGSAYLFVFPIPFWSGFQLESAYHLFKSFNVLFFYVLTPMLLLAAYRIVTNRSLRFRQTIFLAFVGLGFTLAVAGTSLETRHFGAFLTPIMILSNLPNFAMPKDKKAFRLVLSLFLSLVLLIHLAWALLKAG